MNKTKKRTNEITFYFTTTTAIIIIIMHHSKYEQKASGSNEQRDDHLTMKISILNLCLHNNCIRCARVLIESSTKTKLTQLNGSRSANKKTKHTQSNEM